MCPMMINSIPIGNSAITASNSVSAVYLYWSFWMVFVYVYHDD